MRRPTPLPEPEGDDAAAGEPTSSSGGRWGRLFRRTSPGPSATPSAEAGEEPAAPVDAEESPAQAGDPPEPEGAEAVRSRDVWRAARARRRALRAEMRRFTVRSRRRRTVWLSVAAAVVLLVAGSAGAAYSPLFAVERVQIVGARDIPAAELEGALASQIGRPLPLVDESEVKAALVAFPLVESYSLEARPPHELVLRIVERTPVGVVEGDGGWSLVDAAGVVLRTEPEPIPGHPVFEVQGGVGSEAFLAAGRVLRALPESLRAQVATVAATTRDDVALTLGDGTRVAWGSAEGSAGKALVLEKTMIALPPGTVGVYDVSSGEVVVIG